MSELNAREIEKQFAEIDAAELKRLAEQGEIAAVEADDGRTFATLEQRRTAYRDKMPNRDGCTPDQQIAMATIHNQQVARGSCLAIAVLLSKPTLRALVGKGLIDDSGALTRAGDDLLRKWWKEARR